MNNDSGLTNYESIRNLPSTNVIKAGDIGYTKPNLFTGCDKRTYNSIKKACDEIIADDTGKIYIYAKYLDRILRTKKYVVKEIILNIPKDEKISYENNLYVSLPEVTKQINRRLQSLPISKTRNYLMLVELFLVNIRDNDKFVCRRTLIDSNIKSEITKLKNKRIRKYRITHDELTGLKLTKGAQFSHIRAKSVYPSIALDIDNGLIINQDIHEIITSKSICDEDSLYKLCKKMNWETKWYKVFKNICT